MTLETKHAVSIAITQIPGHTIRPHIDFQQGHIKHSADIANVG